MFYGDKKQKKGDNRKISFYQDNDIFDLQSKDLLQRVVDMWYLEVGDSYRKSRRSIGAIDSPKARFFSYNIIAITLGFISAFFFILTLPRIMTLFAQFKIKGNDFVVVEGVILTLILSVSIFCIFSAIRFFRYSKKLENAIQEKKNADLCDVYRMKIILQATKWYEKKKILI